MKNFNVKYMGIIHYITVCSGVALLCCSASSCSEHKMRNALGIKAKSPDEFSAASYQPLDVPRELTLPHKNRTAFIKEKNITKDTNTNGKAATNNANAASDKRR